MLVEETSPLSYIPFVTKNKKKKEIINCDTIYYDKVL